ncbi:hypothetical protein BC937DRAFT_91407 [Endogone sp. FLAS-F59071]|nr:hypothetical protein BC937DRAFT_91407 [Endogone sp. FLAS-F59071]|eukprot:RUS16285.1 hypothetical protein BC937DRAFT_91407 [Endogone sp. FLAS-F59071]
MLRKTAAIVPLNTHFVLKLFGHNNTGTLERYRRRGGTVRVPERVSDPWFASDQQMYSARSLLYYVLGVLVLNMFIAWIWPAPW